MKKHIHNLVLLILLVANNPLFAQTPTVTTQTPVVVTPYIYKEATDTVYTYDAKVTFVGIVNANGLECSVYFEYGPTTSYGNIIMASPALVAGTDDIEVRATSVIHYCGGNYHCRLVVVSGSVTSYGSDISFTPEVDPTIKLLFFANASDDETMTSFTVLNNNYFPVSVTCTDGTNTATLNINQSTMQDFYCNKESVVSFYYNYTNPDGTTTYPFLFREMATNDQTTAETPSPATQITFLTMGYKLNTDSAYIKIINANDVDVELLYIQGTYQGTQIISRNSNRTLLFANSDIDFYYNNILLASFPAQLVKTAYTYKIISGVNYFDDFSSKVTYAFPNRIYLDASDTTMTFRVISNIKHYNAIPYQTWINGGGTLDVFANDVPLSVSIAKNTTGESRTGYIRITGGDELFIITVVQSCLTVPKNNLKIRLRADRGVTTSDSLVSEWDDMSGNGFNAEQSCSYCKPIYVAGAMNNRPVMRFRGTQYFNLPSTETIGIQNNDYELFIVARPSATNLMYLFSSATAEQFEYHIGTAPGARFIPKTSNYLDKNSTGTYCDGKPHIFSARASSTGGAVRVDGMDGSTSTADITSASNGYLQLGRREFDGSYHFYGDFAEVLLYDTVLTPEQRDSVEEYLADRYQIDITPANNAPVARDTLVEAMVATVTTIDLPVSDTDGTISTVFIHREPVNGAAIVSGTSLSYTSDTGFTGNDTIAWYARDNGGAFSDTATLVIHVNPSGPAVDLTVSDTTIVDGTEACFNAQNEITVAGSSTVTVENNATANFIAGTLVAFLPGFHAVSGSYAHAWITEDGAFCNVDGGSPIVEQSAVKSVENQTASENRVEKSVKVYPNPNNGQFTLELTNVESGATVSIYNMLGARVYQSTATNEASHKINLPGIRKGIYFVKVMDGKEQFTKKMVVD